MTPTELEQRILETLSGAQHRSKETINVEALDPRQAKLSDFSGVALDTNILKAFRRDLLATSNAVETLRDNGVSLILPGQTLIEFWNNHQTFARDDWSQISSDVNKLEKTLDRLEALAMVEDRLNSVREIVQTISAELQESTAPDFLERSRDLVETLAGYAEQHMVSRPAFHQLGLVRLHSKVPPGFEDFRLKGEQSLGDFFGWCDFMLSVLSIREQDPDANNFLFVTDDSKPDWKSGTLAHPYLVQEFFLVTGGRLGLGSLREFHTLLRDP